MLNNIDAVIFDLDGTLIDSMWMWKEIDVEYLSKFNLKLPSDLQTEIEGMSFSETAAYFKKRFQLSDTIEKIKADWNEMAYRKYRYEILFKKGALEFLNILKKQNIKTGIATSNSKSLVTAIIANHKIDHLFDSIHTSCEVEKGKPAPDIYLLVAKDLEVAPNRCLVFEDVVNGIKAGKEAKMKVCAVYDDFSKDNDEKKRILADYYIHDFTEI
ncbi:MAG: HAD family hydrolase [Velocimicrobium sp.]